MDPAMIVEATRLGLQWGRPDGVPVPRAAFVAEARSWVGTKFMHQQEMKGVGVDCGGLIRGTSIALGLIPRGYRHQIPESVRAYARAPDGESARMLCEHYWTRIRLDEMQVGDVALIAYGSFPQHAAVIGDYVHGGLSMIHALGPQPPSKVVEHRLDDSWRKRIVSAYSIPGVK